MATRFHHLNVLVRDLEAATARYAAVLDVDFGPVEALPGRGVHLQRARLGDAWLVLVQPLGPGAPADLLAKRGEGFMLVSFGVDKLTAALDRAGSAGVGAVGETRTGLDGWQIADIDAAAMNGMAVQFCEDS